jgi:putative phosphoribosyl transferase
MVFADRVDAGRRLAAGLEYLRGEPVVVLGLPRGGVPVAAEVARALDAPLDIIVVRKLGVPFQPELGMGAIGEDGVRIINQEVLRRIDITATELAAAEERERAELERRARRFRDGRPSIPLQGRTAVVVDDGFATGATARAACRVARARGAERIVLAVPVAPLGWTDRVSTDADECVCLLTPAAFWAIGQFYTDFSQTSDEEVIACLADAPGAGVDTAPPAAATRASRAGTDPHHCDEEVVVPVGRHHLGGHLTVPETPAGIVVFAHGSGSSRHSPRNRFVATVLNRAGFGTLLSDLLTPYEEHDRSKVFDIALLAGRLADVTDWLRLRPDTAGLPVGYFGASTGAAAALWAASEPSAGVAAVVSRGGRPDLAGPRLVDVRAPTLLIVGGEDTLVLDLNRRAQAQLHCRNRLAVIPGATHLFEEPGTLRAAAVVARDWFTVHVVGAAVAPAQ